MRYPPAIRAGFLVALALATAHCNALDRGPGYSNGYGNVNAADNNVLPPVGYQCYPRYVVRDGYVYDVHGHYYKEHNGSWSVLRSAPSVVQHQEPEVSKERLCVWYPP